MCEERVSIGDVKLRSVYRTFEELCDCAGCRIKEIVHESERDRLVCTDGTDTIAL